VNNMRPYALFSLLALPVLFSGCIHPLETVSFSERAVQENKLPAISVKEVKKSLDQKGDCLLIDTRPLEEYSQGHLPSALSIPGYGPGYPGKLPAEKERTVILYCGWAGCRLEQMELQPFVKAGYTNVRIMRGGMESWIKANYPTVSADSFTRGQGNNNKKTRKTEQGTVRLTRFKKALNGTIQATILDVRTNEERAKGALHPSVHIPLNELAQKMNRLPARTTIFTYSASRPRAEMAAEILNKNGFKASFLASDVQCGEKGCLFIESPMTEITRP